MRKSDILPALYLPLVVLYALLQGWRPLGGGYDFWAHAAVGRWIWDHGRAPTTGLFLWSNSGYFWVAHSWLSELSFYLVIKTGGPLLVMIMNACFAALSFALAWRFWQQRGPVNFLTPLLFSLAIYASSSRFQPRQELLTAIILIVLLKFLVRWRDKGDEGPGAAAAPGTAAARVRYLTAANLGIIALFALWINLHALVFWGVVIVVGTAFCDAAQFRFDQRSRVLAAIAIGCMLATLVNPYHIHYWQAAEQLRPGSQTSFIDEWKPFWVRPRLPFGFVYAEAVLGFAAFFGWARNPQRRWAELFWMLITTAMFLKSRRLLWMLSLTYLIVMAANARSYNSESCWRLWRRITGQAGLDEIPDRMRFFAHGVSITIVAAAIGLYSNVFPIASDHYWPIRTIMPNAPVKIARMIQDRNLPGRIFNDYENGSYLQWALNGVDPRTGHVPTKGIRPLYIDLLSAYPDKVFFDYFKILDVRPEGMKILQANKVNTIYLGAHHSFNPIVGYLNRSKEWQRLATGQEGSLWVRRKPLR